MIIESRLLKQPILWLLVSFVLFGCAHEKSKMNKETTGRSIPYASAEESDNKNMEGETFGKAVMQLLLPGYAGDVILGRTEKEGKLLQRIDIEIGNAHVDYATVLYLTNDDIENITKKITVSQKDKSISINYITHRTSLDIDKAFLFLYDSNNFVNLEIFMYNTSKRRWERES